MSHSCWQNPSVKVVVALCVVKALLHLAVVTRYGYHGDELYFIECGRHLAFGYVDHPPLIPWIARIADELGGSLFALRVPATGAGVGTMLLAALFVRDWGGCWRAQLSTLLCLLVAPAYLRMAAMLAIPVFEVFLCTGAAYLASRALTPEAPEVRGAEGDNQQTSSFHGSPPTSPLSRIESRERRQTWSWIAAGGLLGLAILAKHSSLYWAAAFGFGLLMSPARAVLTTRWPWVAALIALAVAAPNFAWQVQNGFPTLEFLQTLQREVLAPQERWLLLAGQFLYFHPLAFPVACAGLIFAFSTAGRAARPFAVVFVVLLAFLLLMKGKPYYLASAYPPVLAAGGVALERWVAARAAVWRTFVASLAITGAGLASLTLPLLRLEDVDAALDAALGWAVPAEILTEDMHNMHGWDEHAATIDRVYRSLSLTERARTTVLAGTYAQASANNVLGSPETPRAVSGSMSYYLWGPVAGRGDVLIAYGVPLQILQRHYQTCQPSARIDPPLARPWDRNLTVHICRQPLGDMTDLWPELRRFGHAPLAAR